MLSEFGLESSEQRVDVVLVGRFIVGRRFDDEHNIGGLTGRHFFGAPVTERFSVQLAVG